MTAGRCPRPRNEPYINLATPTSKHSQDLVSLRLERTSADIQIFFRSCFQDSLCNTTIQRGNPGELRDRGEKSIDTPARPPARVTPKRKLAQTLLSNSNLE